MTMADCCKGLICDPKRKICKESAACHGLAEGCHADADCCKGLACLDGACGTPRHCVEDGDPCHPSLPCCHDLICNGYVCEKRPTVPTGNQYGTGGTTSALPKTGSGRADDISGLITLAVLGGSALAAGWLFREQPAESDAVEE